ncbi:hypothetical protein GALL_117540 [mine drainage metagenome]|uniref:Uncharacterized protein n=1 Tax=mine drainage metagenome TaxID=410659 RepID=A0A1J5SPH5_9ZZZZ
MPSLEKRKWCYVLPPATYEMAPCTCGNADTQWSEFVGKKNRCDGDDIIVSQRTVNHFHKTKGVLNA